MDPPSNDSVYPVREDTFLLLPFARSAKGLRLLEVGCGTGRAALDAARAGARVVATDLNPAAVRSVRAAAKTERLDVAVVRADLARGLGRFDRVLVNPPYLPTRPSERDPDRWHNLALDGGPDGARVTRRIARLLPGLLTPNGRAYLVVSSRQDPEALRRIRERWVRAGGSVKSVASRDLPGERLEVWELRLAALRGTTGGRPRTRGRRSGTGDRPQSRGANRTGSSRAPGRGRTTAPGAASGQRRSPAGS